MSMRFILTECGAHSEHKRLLLSSLCPCISGGRCVWGV